MARSFNGSTNKLNRSGAVVSNEPITLACWFNINDITTNRCLIGLGNNGSNGVWRLAAVGAIAGDPIRAQKQNDSGTLIGNADTTSGYSTNTWHHAAAVFSADNSRAAYLDGGNKGTDTTNVSDPTPDFTSIGVLKRGAESQYMDGEIAEAAIWDAALTDAEIASLAEGVSPIKVRPESLVAYWPLIGTYSPEIDKVGGADLTVTGAIKASHPRVIYPRRKHITTAPEAVEVDDVFFQNQLHQIHDGLKPLTAAGLNGILVT